MTPDFEHKVQYTPKVCHLVFKETTSERENAVEDWTHARSENARLVNDGTFTLT